VSTKNIAGGNPGGTIDTILPPSLIAFTALSASPASYSYKVYI
jgi:hypothetical protein